MNAAELETLEAVEARLWRSYGALLVFMRETSGISRTRLATYLGCSPGVLNAVEEGRGLTAPRYRRIAERIELLAEQNFDLTRAERSAEVIRQVLREDGPTDEDYLAVYRLRAKVEV